MDASIMAVQAEQPVMAATIHRIDAGAAPRIDAGPLTFGSVGSDPGAVPDAGSGGSTQATDSGVDAGDAGHKLAADGGAHRSCPLLPSEQNESFCYDFEDGVNGPNAGDTYDLWTTPQFPAEGQLTLVALPADPHNHVLQTKPSLGTGEAGAALSHSTHPFESATVDFDIWVDQPLLQTSADVSWFRYVPMDGDYDHVTALIFRRGQALLLSESHKEQPLSMLPRTDNTPVHVTVNLNRHSPCQTDVLLDGHMVANLTEEVCAPDRTGFVEFGLDMVDRTSGQLSARYDNLTWTRK